MLFSQAFDIMPQDVEIVLIRVWSRIKVDRKMGREALVEKIFSEINCAEHDRVENAALEAGIDIDENTDRAYDKIEQILVERGILVAQPSTSIN